MKPLRELKQGGLLSVVLPSYNEEASIPRAAERITQLLTAADIPFELLFVDDGSKDGSWAAIQTQAARFPQVRGVRFSRNFGKEAAIFAGLAQARGDCAAVMDCDLQHPPEKLEEMYRLWQQGYEVIEGVKVSRGKESPLHAFAAHRFYDILSRWTCPGPLTLSCWTGKRWIPWWPCGRRTPFSGLCRPGSAFPPPRWSLRSSPGWRGSPNGR